MKKMLKFSSEKPAQESVQRIIVHRALSCQHPWDAQQVIDWLEQTAAGQNDDPTPFVWNGKRANAVNSPLRRSWLFTCWLTR
jgi:hypothetical protein